MLPRLLGLFLLLALLLAAALFAFAQLAPPTDRLYALLAETSVNGWTASLRREAGDLYIALGDINAGLAHWEAALLISPRDELLARRTAELYVQRGRWPEALDAVRRLLGLLPDDPWATLHAGMILSPTAPGEALAYLRRAAQGGIQPPSGLIQILEQENGRGLALAVGTVMADAGLYQYAERAFGIAVTLDAAPAEALASVALMRGLQGKDGQASLDRAVTLAPDSPEVHTVAGLYYRATGHNFPSLESFAMALSLDPLNPELNAELARSYELLGNGVSAAFWYGQAAQLSRGEDDLYDQMYRTAIATITPILELVTPAAVTITPTPEPSPTSTASP